MATVNISAMAKTWNDAGTTFTAIGLDVTDTASNAASLLMDLQVGGSSQFTVTKAGAARVAAGSAGAPGMSFVGDTDTGIFNAGSQLNIAVSGIEQIAMMPSLFWFKRNDAQFALGASADARLHRDAAAALAFRNGTTAQTPRVYGTFTDASNYERMTLSRDAITLESAGTGAANIDLALTPAGTGVLKFGTHTALGGESVSGYITIKDAGGTSRKVAVVS